jgi:carbamoyltransferase
MGPQSIRKQEHFSRPKKRRNEGFSVATGVPVLLNTSFNLRGEPIVTTPANAFNTFSKSGIDVLLLENFLIRK